MDGQKVPHTHQHESSDPPGGHSFGPTQIYGGSVHLGDRYYSAEARHLRSPSSEWQARPKLSELSNDEDHLYIVPHHSSFQFTGRHLETNLIETYFASSLTPSIGPRHKIIVLYGLGGSGKTQVCLRYAETFRHLYWGIFWIDVSTVTNAQASYTYLAQQAEVGTTWMAGMYWLSQCVRPWLLVLDNVDDPELDLTTYIPAGSRGQILVTTRLSDYQTYATAGRIKFDKMEPEEAIELLLKAAYPDDQYARSDTQHRSIAKDIATELGHLAIALNQAGATVRRKIYTLERYLRSYLGKRHRLLNTKSISPEEINVITTWEIPFRRIETSNSPEYRDAADLVHVFAFLHHESIPEALFQRLWSGKHQQIPGLTDLPALMRPSHSSIEEAEARFRRAIRVLAGFSIIEHDINSNTCSLHPVVHEWAESRISDDKKMIFWLKCTLYLLACSASSELLSTTSLHHRSILPHVDSCSEVILKRARNILATREAIDQIETFASIYEANGSWEDALVLLELISDFRRKCLGHRHEDFLRAQRSCARCYWNLFEIQSTINIQKDILITRWWIRPSVLDWRNLRRPEHLSYCIACDDLAQTLWLAGALELSRRAGEHALRAMTKQLDENDPRLWNAAFNLGRTLRHLGELNSAHRLLAYVVRKRKHTFGRNHPETLMARNELGMNFWARKQHLEIAERLVTNVYEARKVCLGREHAYTLWSANDLSKIFYTRGRTQQAVQLLQDIIPIVEATLGPKHVGMVMTKGNLARAHARGGQWIEAEAALCSVLQHVDEDHADWFPCMYGYVRVKTELGDTTEAEAACQKILKKFSAEAKEATKYRSATELLANVYLKSGQHQELLLLKKRHTWMNATNIEKPPLFL